MGNVQSCQQDTGLQELSANCKIADSIKCDPCSADDHPHAYKGHAHLMDAIREAECVSNSEQLDGVFDCEVIKLDDAFRSVSPWDTLKSHAETMQRARSRSPSPPVTPSNDNGYTRETRLSKVAQKLAYRRIVYDSMGRKVFDEDPDEILDSVWPEHARQPLSLATIAFGAMHMAAEDPTYKSKLAKMHEEAAVKIQSAYRGKAARKQVASKRQARQAPDSKATTVVQMNGKALSVAEPIIQVKEERAVNVAEPMILKKDEPLSPVQVALQIKQEKASRTPIKEETKESKSEVQPLPQGNATAPARAPEPDYGIHEFSETASALDALSPGTLASTDAASSAASVVAVSEVDSPFKISALPLDWQKSLGQSQEWGEALTETNKLMAKPENPRSAYKRTQSPDQWKSASEDEGNSPRRRSGKKR